MKTFKTFLNEGVNDPAIFKAVFLAGGPGSGKSFFVGKTGLTQLGYRIVNSDDAFERAMEKAGLDMGDPDSIASDAGQQMRGAAKKLTAKKQELLIKGRLGLVIDGTGRDVNKIAQQAVKMQSLGYEVAMIFVNTDEDTASSRNKMRKRKLKDPLVRKFWNDVQKNMGKFQKIFGRKNFLVVDNSDGGSWEKETTRAYREMVKFTKTPPKTTLAKKWISQEKKNRGIKEETTLTEKKEVIINVGDAGRIAGRLKRRGGEDFEYKIGKRTGHNNRWTGNELHIIGDEKKILSVLKSEGLTGNIKRKT